MGVGHSSIPIFIPQLKGYEHKQTNNRTTDPDHHPDDGPTIKPHQLQSKGTGESNKR